ncbi:MAG: hypothetical protein B7C24_08125 [Bacteroidetes bacterium 4572_77]|nr:MAG: hypothetical protein B7C24_08125 [Bacteroidetes bacterium 4572_77]
MNRAQKIHYLKVIKVLLNGNAVIIECIKEKDIYLTMINLDLFKDETEGSRLEIPESIRKALCKDAIVIEDASRWENDRVDWVSIPKK